MQGILYTVVLLSPWALGGTAAWMPATLNGLGLGLAVLWLLHRRLCLRAGFTPPLWPDPLSGWPRWVLGGLTLLILSLCLLSAINGRSGSGSETDTVPSGVGLRDWLPGSRDAASSWKAFWLYLSLAAVFWASRDWLRGRTSREARAGRDEAPEEAFGSGYVPRRLRGLLWVLCVNTAVVAAVALFQRLQGTDKLLWLVRDPLGSAERHFGPFPYRNHGAALVNMVWPVGLGLWGLLHRRQRQGYGRSARVGGSPDLLLLFLAVFMISGPLIASSRGGVLIGGVMAAGVVLILALSGGIHARRGTLITGLVLGVAAGLGGWLGWDRLSKRLFPPHFVVPTQRPALEDFSLRGVFEVAVPRQILGTIVGLSDTNRILYARPGATHLSVLQSGALEFGLFDTGNIRRVFQRLPQFASNQLGRVTEVVAVRQATNGYLYVDGRLQTGTNPVPVRPADTSAGLPAAFLWVGSMAGGSLHYPGGISEVSLYDRALLPNEVAALAAARQGSPSKEEARGALPPPPLVQFRPRSLNPLEWWSRWTGDRQLIHQLATELVQPREHLFGTGPGTIPELFRAQGPPLSELADPHVHNDWLETRITFGWVGLGLVVAALLTALGGPLMAIGPAGLHPLFWYLLLSLGGCLLHAWQDLLLQNPAVLTTFLVLVSAASSLGGKGQRGAEAKAPIAGPPR